MNEWKNGKRYMFEVGVGKWIRCFAYKHTCATWQSRVSNRFLTSNLSSQSEKGHSQQRHIFNTNRQVIIIYNNNNKNEDSTEPHKFHQSFDRSRIRVYWQLPPNSYKKHKPPQVVIIVWSRSYPTCDTWLVHASREWERESVGVWGERNQEQVANTFHISVL